MSTDQELRIAICDDEPACRGRIVEMTRQILTKSNISGGIIELCRGSALLDAMHSGIQFHILLLDVMMPEQDGMELAAVLRRQRQTIPIIFISSNREMALRGYEVSAVRFLAKPVEAEKLEEALLHCYRIWLEKREILLPTEQGQYRISFSDIEYAEAFERGTRFLVDGEAVLTKLKFSEVQTLLPQPPFLLCHRAYMVNSACIKRIRATAFELRSGAVIPISKHRYSEVSRRFSDYITA